VPEVPMNYLGSWLIEIETAMYFYAFYLCVLRRATTKLDSVVD